MKAVYFAWVRERIGKADEEIAPPAEVATVGELIALMKAAKEPFQVATPGAGTVNLSCFGAVRAAGRG